MPVTYPSGSGGAEWGDLTGTLSDQTDLQAELDGKSATSHNHAGVYEPAGVAAADITDSTATGRALITATDAAAGRTALSLGTIATQAANNVSISGGSVAGITDLAIADGGTGASTAQNAINALTAVSGATNEHVLTKDTATGNAVFKAAAAGGVSDGDKGDVTVPGSGATWTIDNNVVTYAKMQDVSATDRLLGRDTAAAGDAEEIPLVYGLAFTGGPGLSVSLTQTSAYVTAQTTVSAATYADITGASVSLAAGTWLVIGQVVHGAVNAVYQGFFAITHNDNTVISEIAQSRPASGTASLQSPMTATLVGIVSPGSTTTYKLRAARGVTTHTGSFTVIDGNGVNTTNHLTNNTDKGTGIFAVRIA